MKKKTLPRIIRSEETPEMTGRDGYRKAEPHLRRDFDYRCAYCMVHEQQVGGTEARNSPQNSKRLIFEIYEIFCDL